MYNEGLKLCFINDYTQKESVRELCLYTFNSIQRYEEKLATDICAIREDDLMEILEDISGIQSNSRVRVIRAYVKWCLEHNIENACDDLLKIDFEPLEKIRTRMVSNPLHLQMVLDEIFDAESAMSIDNVYRCYCWLAFMGVPESEAITIPADDVDLENLTVSSGRQKYRIYPESLPAFRNCKLSDSFIVADTEKKRYASNNILRGIKSPFKAVTLRSAITKRKKRATTEEFTPKEISYSWLWLSGVFYRMYESERAGIKPDFGPLAVMHMENRNFYPEKNSLMRKRVNEFSKNFLRRYQLWKKVYC